jgi:hypothetical protein
MIQAEVRALRKAEFDVDRELPSLGRHLLVGEREHGGGTSMPWVQKKPQLH